jgi:hypothetical protein
VRFFVQRASQRKKKWKAVGGKWETFMRVRGGNGGALKEVLRSWLFGRWAAMVCLLRRNEECEMRNAKWCLAALRQCEIWNEEFVIEEGRI